MALFAVHQEERLACEFKPEPGDPSGSTVLFYRRIRPERLREIRREITRELQAQNVQPTQDAVGERINERLCREGIVGCRNFYRLADPATQRWEATDEWEPEFVAELPVQAQTVVGNKLLADTLTEAERRAFLFEAQSNG